MSMRSIQVFLLIGLLCVISDGSSSREAPTRIVLDQTTVQIEGWFSAKGEWKVLPIKHLEDYYPYDLEENEKCVSIVNGTGAPRASLDRLGGRKVIVKGFSVKYDNLPIGESRRDKLLSRRYYEDQPVFNFCLRDFVFVATDIRQVGR